MDIEPDQLEADERTVSEDLQTDISPVDENVPLPSTSTKTDSSSGHTTKQQFDIFLHNLANCVNKELIDSAAIEFLLNLNTKNNRKKLTNAVFGVQRFIPINAIKSIYYSYLIKFTGFGLTFCRFMHVLWLQLI